MNYFTLELDDGTTYECILVSQSLLTFVIKTVSGDFLLVNRYHVVSPQRLQVRKH